MNERSHIFNVIQIPEIRNESCRWQLLFCGPLLASLLFAACSSATPRVATHSPAVPQPTPTNTAPHAVRLMVDITTNAMQTLIGFINPPPFPRPRGNWLYLEFTRPPSAPNQLEIHEHWRVINIHAENLSEIARRLDTKTVEMAIFPITNFQAVIHHIEKPDPPGTSNQNSKIIERPILQKQAYAIVTDSRIPRDWFHSEPSWHQPIDPKIARAIKAAHPASFRAPK